MATPGRPRLHYGCSACGVHRDTWASQCSGCGAWNTLKVTSAAAAAINAAAAAMFGALPPEAPIAARPLPLLDATARPSDAFRMRPMPLPRSPLMPIDAPFPTFRSTPIALTDIDVKSTPKISTSLASLDRVLGSKDRPGMAPASIVLLTADPGAGKSSLAGQVAAALARDLPTLYASGEETDVQVAERAIRINACNEHVRFVAESDTDQILAHVDALGVRFLVIDSMQTITKAGMAAGTDNTIRACIKQIVSRCKERGVNVWIIGHVTKSGGAAGPQTLAHMVDVTIHIHLDEDFPEIRTIRVVGKNRFGVGAGGEIGYFRMTETGLVDLDDEEKAEHERKVTERDAKGAGNGEAGGSGGVWEPLARELYTRACDAGIDVDDLRERFRDLL